MAKFASPARQAASVMKALQGDVLRSVGTVRNYEQALTRVAEWMKINRLNHADLRTLTPALAIRYLLKRAENAGQSTLNMERQAMQAMMQHVTLALAPGERLTVIKTHTPDMSGRAYTPAQVAAIIQAQHPDHALATELAYVAGLRAHELFSLLPGPERDPHPRPHAGTKFCGREGLIYTVHGKGGLIRQVLIPASLAERLEARRLPAPRRITDRKVHYLSHYDITGGQRWSNSFSAASRRALGWSHGAHGLRHSYAQQRLRELQQQRLLREDAKRTVSQEIGHFRPDITDTYLR